MAQSTSLAWAQRRTRPQPGVTLHFQDVALNFQVLAAHPGTSLTTSDLCVTLGQCSCFCCYVHIPRVFIAQVAQVDAGSCLLPIMPFVPGL